MQEEKKVKKIRITQNITIKEFQRHIRIFLHRIIRVKDMWKKGKVNK